MMQNPRLTLIIAVYQNARALELILAALDRQSFKDFEVIIADDGSGKTIADVVNNAKRSLHFRIKHLWHADKGWRKNRMLNYAIDESSADYLVFIDGDCIPAKHFLYDHINNREKEKALLGRRVEHGKRWAEALTVDMITSGMFERYTISDLIDAIKGVSVRLEHGIRITNPMLRKITQPRSGVLGCNFSIDKEHLLEVNGFDESYVGPGVGEDTDILYRLQLIGITGKSLRNLAIQYHLWHTFTDVSEINRLRFAEVQNRASPICLNGLKKL